MDTTVYDVFCESSEAELVLMTCPNCEVEDYYCPCGSDASMHLIPRDRPMFEELVSVLCPSCDRAVPMDIKQVEDYYCACGWASAIVVIHSREN